ncbi:hypothetical protein RJ564_06535 [Helicobacter pylori]|uniref:hypothetical protein n=1 Tax=Helicobacter pylori TaxID=210 RepID=UPI001E505F5B|nr:hypothetical protein [Helicobacter pylori]WNE36555.1 hypothetical protein RJ564_06535 [Helicobacter pylori]
MTESPVGIDLNQHDLSRFFSSILIKFDANFSCHYTQTHTPFNGVKLIDKTLSFLIFLNSLNNPLKKA